MSALCFIKVAPGKVNEAAAALTAIPGVRTVYSVTGAVDIVAIIEVIDHEKVADVVNLFVTRVPGVIGTETHIAFRTYRPEDIEDGFSIGAEPGA